MGMMENMGWLPRPKVALTPTRERIIRIALPVAAYVGLVLLRTHDITRTFWLFSDQILYWDTAQLPFTQQPLVGPEQHVGGYALGPAYNWFVWLSRVTLGPFVDNLPHAGAVFQVLVHSAFDGMLLYALWRKTRSIWQATAAMFLVTTAPYDLALSATLWNPSLASAAIKGAMAAVLLGWPERSLVGVGVVAGLAWVAMHFHVPAVFCVASVFVALVITPVIKRDYRLTGLRVSVIAMVVGVMQLPYLVHRTSAVPDTEPGGVAVTDSLGATLSGEASLRIVESVVGLGHAIDRILVDPWEAGWVGWVVAVCAVAVVVRRRDDMPLQALTVLPLLFSVVGYAFWVGSFDEYYYLSQMTPVVLTVLFGATALAGRRATYVGVAALILALALLPGRVRQARTIHRMPGYGLLVDGSREVLRRGVSVRAITADFLPLGADPEYLFTVLGGNLDPDGVWVAHIQPDGLVSWESTASR